MTLRQHLDAAGYGAEFRQLCLAPILSILFVTRTALFDLPLPIAAKMFLRGLCFFVPMPCRIVRGGSPVKGS